jgi:RNA polymerase sigma-70 factor, ECF subfamily
LVAMATLRTTGPSLSVVSSEAKGSVECRVSRRDDEILEAVRRGDVVVAEDFYWRIKPIVDRTIRRLVGRLDRDGEDLVQIALVQLIESLPSYRGECPLDAWVSTVAAHVVYKHIRRRRLERTIFESALDDDEERSTNQKTPGIAQRIVLRDAVKQVVEHLTTMRSERAWAFVLHDVCGYSLDEVAHICGVSVVAAQSRLVRGRRELHQMIAADPRLVDLLERGET